MVEKNNRKAALKKLKTLAYTSKYNEKTYRARIEKAFSVDVLPNHVERTERDFGNVRCDVLVPELYSSKRIMFYVHGGCFVGGSRASYREFCSVLSDKACSRIVVPEYRLAPAYPFPAAIEDVQTAFRVLFTEEQIARSLDSNGESREENQPEVIIAADGAGASIAIALLLNLRERYRRCIKQVVLFSPWLNLSNSSPLKTGKKVCDEIMSADVLSRSGEVYTYSSNLENPLVSPVFAAKELLEGFPPVYIQCGEKENLLDEAKNFTAMLKECGCDCRLEIWPDMMHLFQMADEYLKESHDALDAFSRIIAGTEKGGNTVRQTFENKPKLEQSLKAEA